MIRILALALCATTLALGAARAQEQSQPGERARAIFAGGCFWCVEADFDKVPGVLATTSGYVGGTVPNPTYQQVTAGGTGHAEAVEIVYDPSVVTYDQLLHVYWRTIDPLTANAQFCDVGESYRPAIFPVDAEQERLADASRTEISGRFDVPIAVTIEDFDEFYAAEDYHQDYYEKNPLAYRFYRWNCGRDARIEALWGDEAGGLGIFEDEGA